MDPRRRYGSFARRPHDFGSDEPAQMGAHTCQLAPYWTASDRQNGSLMRFFSGYLCRRSHSVHGSQMEERREKTFLHKGLRQILRSRSCTNGNLYFQGIRQSVISDRGSLSRYSESYLSKTAFEACQRF